MSRLFRTTKRIFKNVATATALIIFLSSCSQLCPEGYGDSDYYCVDFSIPIIV